MLNDIKGVGPKKATLLNKLGIYKKRDLLDFLPINYEDKREVFKLNNNLVDRKAMYKLTIKSKSRPIRTSKGMLTSIKAFDESNQCEINYFHDIYTARKLEIGKEYLFYGQINESSKKYTMYNPELLDNNSTLGLVPLYQLSKGLFQNELRRFISQTLDSTPVDDFLPQNLLTLRQLVDLKTAYELVHRPFRYEDINKSKKRLLYQELLLLIISLNYIRQNQLQESAPINSSYSIVNKLLNALEFNLTTDQAKVLEDIFKDMESSVPMNRIIQGDVGSGKTIVAILAAVFSASNNNQCAFIAPTEVLAKQHYDNYVDRLENLGIRTALLTGSTPSSHKREIKKKLESGKLDVLIGTHALIQKDVVFKNLGLVITDEQHRFGVKQRGELISKGENPHVLVMSATPIPRTLALTIYGDLDISTIKVLPSGRLPIETYTVNKSYEKRVFDFIAKHIENGRQAYIVCPAIESEDETNLETVYDIYERLSNYINIKSKVLHGQLSKDEQEEIIGQFKNNEFSVLISTTVVEVGVDIPNATVMVIYNSERFGLAQLHQLRGRVGRGNYQSYCVMICTSNSKNARERMAVLEKSNDGFVIADKDLELRGPGEILGHLQHGSSILHNDGADFKKILEFANSDAKNIIKTDPKLDLIENKAIKSMVMKTIDRLISSKSLN